VEASGTALVTGASRGIGRAVAIDLARAGFDVIATMRNPEDGSRLEDEVRDGAGSIRAARLDVDAPESIEIPAGLKVLVNNAGIERQYLPVESTPEADWRAVFETNLFGLVSVTRAAIPVMRDAGGGAICNVTSSSVLAAVPFYSLYRASKAAVSALGESLRMEVAQFGIRVIEVMPGPIETDMLARSDRVPEAAAMPAYRELALEAHEQRRGVAGLTTPVAEAARRIRLSILDDDGPLKTGCDPLADGLLEAWGQDPVSLVGRTTGKTR
jgi:NAD(P)-dependent dehydrogenase (short-subunit alcohol dehydrogenase family)